VVDLKGGDHNSIAGEVASVRVRMLNTCVNPGVVQFHGDPMEFRHETRRPDKTLRCVCSSPPAGLGGDVLAGLRAN